MNLSFDIEVIFDEVIFDIGLLLYRRNFDIEVQNFDIRV
jgi:hypothetical protein